MNYSKSGIFRIILIMMLGHITAAFRTKCDNATIPSYVTVIDGIEYIDDR